MISVLAATHAESQRSPAVPFLLSFFVVFFWTELVLKQDEVAVDLITNLAWELGEESASVLSCKSQP